MAQIFNMPQPGSTMEEGTILRWCKQEGESITKGEVLLEIETDKASVEVEAEFDGVVRKILRPENALVAVREPIAILGTADEPIDALLAQIRGGDKETRRQGEGEREAPTPDTQHATSETPTP